MLLIPVCLFIDRLLPLIPQCLLLDCIVLKFLFLLTTGSYFFIASHS